jgi:VIT1/CCC1 family predicted Fe2+/Mn2+ transporter
MINGLITMLRKVFGLFVDDGSLALSILVWIFALHVVMPIVPTDQRVAAPVLFLGCIGILIENVLRASRQPLAPAEADKHGSADKRSALAFSDSLLSQSVEIQTVSPALRDEGKINEPTSADPKLARQLVLDELFDLSLYQSLRNVAGGELRAILDQLIPIEQRHFAFWQDFFDLHVNTLDLARRLKLVLLVAVCRLFRAPAIHLVLEAIEVYGVRKYLRVWSAYGNGPLGAAVRNILEDEFKHEDEVVTGDAERKLNPARVRDIFLGLNDGLIEILGAVSGFFAAFGNSLAVLVAGLTVAVAGALSMAAGAWIAVSSESEVRTTEVARRRFLGESVSTTGTAETPLGSAIIVGASYLAGALVPVLPVLGGATTVLPSLLTAGSLIILVSIMVAFLSGMDIKRRVMTNLLIITAAVGISFAVGIVTKRVWGVSV